MSPSIWTNHSVLFTRMDPCIQRFLLFEELSPVKHLIARNHTISNTWVTYTKPKANFWPVCYRQPNRKWFIQLCSHEFGMVRCPVETKTPLWPWASLFILVPVVGLCFKSTFDQADTHKKQFYYIIDLLSCRLRLFKVSSSFLVNDAVCLVCCRRSGRWAYLHWFVGFVV